MQLKFKGIKPLLALIALGSSVAFAEKTRSLSTQENWWLGIVSQGEKMPLDTPFKADLNAYNYGNQAQPLLLSANGHVVWSEKAFSLQYQDKTAQLKGNSDIEHSRPGKNLKEAYLYASNKYFPPSGKMPADLLFTAPQYNTWIELTYNQNQQDILKYARSIIDHGLPPGVLMIDDTWQEAYGKWRFHPARFPNPKAMMAELHQMGFKVMLWVAPFVSGDSVEYRHLEAKGGLLREDTPEALPVMVPWWNGRSAVLDLSNPVDQQWFQAELDYLQAEFKVDGFKLDAGDPEFYQTGKSHGQLSPNQQTEAFSKVGLNYPFNEYRATWKMGGQALVQRLRDKDHSWEDLRKLVPQMNLMGIMGYPFSCPDMIGGGQFKAFLDGATMDQELIVRSAQAHALMPMMQFSVAPWRVLSPENMQRIKQAVEIREKFKALILSEARKSAKTGEPIMRLMEYDFPHQGYAKVKDQFLIGKKLLVAPILKKSASSRTVFLPEGKWRSYDGRTVQGPAQLQLKVSLDDLPYFELTDD